MEWLKEAVRLADKDEGYMTYLEKLKAVEPAFLALRESLTQWQRDVLEEYLIACEGMDMALARIAYGLGKKNG